MKPMHAQGGMPIPGIVHIRQPYWYGEGGDLTPDEFGLVAARALEEKILELGPDKVAAFIAEPVQGAGGVVIPPRSYWPEIQRIVDKYGILLVVDEVICGFGRTGAWFGSDYYGVRPDLMPIAKGMSSGYMPIGGLMVGDRVAAALLDEDREFHHGFTYSGHPAACAVACAAINILRNEKVVEHVRDVAAPYLAQRWAGLADHPLVGETRTLGLLGAIELVRDKSKRQFFQDPGKVGTLCRDICFDNGLVMRAVRDTMIVSPPLVITRAQIDELADKARRCLDLAWAAVQKGDY
jgi:putrescine aminotransferase